MKRILIGSKTCLNCGKEFTRDSCKRVSDYKKKKYCSKECYWACQGEKHPLYIDGIKHRPDGYLRTREDKYIHRIIIEEKIGRPLTHDEMVHHKDGNPSNNNIDNLEVVSLSEHRRIESQIQPRAWDGRFIKKI